MKKTAILLLGFLMITSLCYSQALNTNDRDASVKPLPKNPEKASKVMRDVKIKSVQKEKQAIIANHRVTFLTTAFYKYKENSRAGKVGQKVGFALKGVSDKTFQEITDETNNYLIKKLKENGYTLEEYSKIVASKKYAKFKTKTAGTGQEYETQNLDLTKKVKAKTFTGNKTPSHPAIVGNTAHFGLVKDVGSTFIVSDFKINFLSIGHEVSQSNTVSSYTTEYGIEVEECIYGTANIEFLTPKLKMGTVSSKRYYRHGDLMRYTTDKATTADGFIIVNADEAAYKKRCIELINNYIDLTFQHITEVTTK